MMHSSRWVARNAKGPLICSITYLNFALNAAYSAILLPSKVGKATGGAFATFLKAFAISFYDAAPGAEGFEFGLFGAPILSPRVNKAIPI